MSTIEKLFLTTLLLVLSTAASAQIGFGPPQPVAGPPSALLAHPLALIDLDGDGGHDVLQPYILSGITGLARNVPVGFKAISQIPALPLTGILSVADLDADGVQDLVSYNTTGVQAILGHGYGRFGSLTNSPGSHLNYNLAVDDFDNDGLPDVLLFGGQLFSGEIAYRQGLGDGSFGPEQVIIPTGMSAYGVGATGHIDDNGFLDAVITTGFGPTLSPKVFCLMNRGGGVFEVVEETLPAPPAGLTLADLDGNGRADLVMNGSGGLRVLRGQGDGTFAPVQTVTFASTGSAVVDDFDRDGHPDIAYLSGSPATIQIFRQSQALRFEPAGTSGGWAGGVLKSADVDHDGFPDLIASGNLPGFSWARNRATTTLNSR